MQLYSQTLLVVEKVHLFLDLVEKEYNKHCIIIIFPMLQWNKILSSIILHHTISYYIILKVVSDMLTIGSLNQKASYING